MSKVFKWVIGDLFPIIDVCIFILGINMILECASGYYSSNYRAAIIAGMLICVFAGICFVVYIKELLRKIFS